MHYAMRFVLWGALAVSGVSSHWAAHAPSSSHRALRSLSHRSGGGLRMALPKDVQEIVDSRFKRTYPEGQVNALWQAVKTAYGSEANALQAIKQNPKVINPLYTTSPSIVSRSKEALVEVLGKEEAIAVMLKNPAILQCGSGLRSQPATQIKSFATVRQLLDRLPDETPTYSLGTFALLLTFVLVGKNGGLPEQADIVVQGVGQLLGVVGFCITIGSAILQNVAETGRPSSSGQ